MTEIRGDVFEHSVQSDVRMEGYPQWLRERLEWFKGLKFGLFIHWGIYCQWDCCESWPLVPEDEWARVDSMKCWVERDKDIKRFQRDYWQLSRTFNPVNFNAHKWAEAAEYAGMKYVNFTTKHHDGFCMWDTKTTDYRVTGSDCAFRGDPRANITKEVFDAFRKRDFAISCYFSKSDWKSPYYWKPDAEALTRNPNYDTYVEPEVWEQFVQYTHQQIEELMSGYGHVDCLWLDGGQVRPPDQDIRMGEIAAMARRHQPGLIIVDRTVGGEYENVLTPERMIPDKPLGHPWESCLPIGNDWCHTEGDTYRPVGQLIHLLIETVAKGGNLLLGAGPKPDGTLPYEIVERLKAIGSWMKINSEAIYGSNAVHPFAEGDIRFTKNGKYVYAFVMIGADGRLRCERVSIRSLVPAKGSDVYLLGYDKPLAWELIDGAAVIELPVCVIECEYAAVLRYQAE